MSLAQQYSYAVTTDALCARLLLHAGAATHVHYDDYLRFLTFGGHLVGRYHSLVGIVINKRKRINVCCFFVAEF